ncbi:hypothetical protein Hanom_Chr00s116159g01809681 [Helianthus anomalus]
MKISNNKLGIVVGSVNTLVNRRVRVKAAKVQQVRVNKDIWSAGSSLGSRYISFGSVDSVKPSQPGQTWSTH